MKKYLLLLLFLLVLGCIAVDHEVEISVINNSGEEIREITFFTSNKKEKVWFDRLRPNESASVTIDIKDYDANGDFTFEYINEKGEKMGTSGNYFDDEFQNLHLDFKVSNEGIDVNKRQISKAKI